MSFIALSLENLSTAWWSLSLISVIAQGKQLVNHSDNSATHTVLIRGSSEVGWPPLLELSDPDTLILSGTSSMSDNFIFLVAGRADDTRLFRLLLGMFRLLLGVRLGFTGMKADTMLDDCCLDCVPSKYPRVNTTYRSFPVFSCIGGDRISGFNFVKSYEGTSTPLDKNNGKKKKEESKKWHNILDVCSNRDSSIC